MIDKSKRKATVEQNGNMVVVRMTGGLDCLWLNMYLDTLDWQMTCDSDIGFYAYHWGRPRRDDGERFIDFCLGWLSNEDWLLRKCIGDRHAEKEFDAKKTRQNIMRSFLKDNDEDVDTFDLEEALDYADSFDNCEAWEAAFAAKADSIGIDLPEEWWSDIVRDYTIWQKRFAEICREVIVPELRMLAGGVQDEWGSQEDCGCAEIYCK